MHNNTVRVRFAPSPTGGLHLGGIRTILFNYLFAKHNKGTFVVRIEDTDQTRYVPGAEEYIFECLEWTGLLPDESVQKEGAFGPYRQSERKEIYKKYSDQLIADGYAYYAFDTQEELEQMRTALKTKENPAPQYDRNTRMQMRNSLSLSKEETDRLLAENTPYVVRLKVPENETIGFVDMIRGPISNDSNLVDDKVLMKADGMPTYHLAVVVDDYLMKITHAFRGEEWLPSAPVHLLLWRYLGWESEMPQWAHLPLILKPDGNGKLSKRDGERLGFPVFAMDWKDPNTGEMIKGFKENGFLPEAFINILALLGWNDGTEQEIFSIEELIEKFSMERIHKGGAKFDYEKAKWFNQQYIQKMDDAQLAKAVLPFLQNKDIHAELAQLTKAVSMTKERCHLLTDFIEQTSFLFQTPEKIDIESIQSKWDEEKQSFFQQYAEEIVDGKKPTELEEQFTQLSEQMNLKKGQLMLPLRIMLVGGKFGPGVFDILEFIGAEEARKRITNTLSHLEKNS